MKFSTSKAWRNVACCVSTVLVLWDTYKFGLDPWILVVYLGAVGGIEWIQTVVKGRFGTMTETSSTKTVIKEPLDATA